MASLGWPQPPAIIGYAWTHFSEGSSLANSVDNVYTTLEGPGIMLRRETNSNNTLNLTPFVHNLHVKFVPLVSKSVQNCFDNSYSKPVTLAITAKMERWTLAHSQGYGQPSFTRMDTSMPGFNVYWIEQMPTKGLRDGWTLASSQGYGQPSFTRMYTALHRFNFYWIEHMTTTMKSRNDGHLQAHEAMDNPASQGLTLLCQV